jgi:hypothetical protein
MATEDTTAQSSTTVTPTPKEEKNTVARKVNAWGFVTLVVLLFLVFGPVAAILSWRSNTLEGANVGLKVVFAVLAYFGNFLYILWFAFKKTIFPAPADSRNDAMVSIGSPFSAPTPAAPAPAPAPVAVDELDDMYAMKATPVAAPPAASPVALPAAPPAPQQGGKKKLKMRRRR